MRECAVGLDDALPTSRVKLRFRSRQPEQRYGKSRTRTGDTTIFRGG
jgi:hypothetical protein